MRGAATNRVGTVIAAARHAGRSIDVSGCAYGPATGDRFLDGPRSYYGFLAGMAAVTRPERVLEIGTHHGGSALALALGQVTARLAPKVLTLDVDDRAGDAVRAHGGVELLLGDIRDPGVFAEVQRWTGADRIGLLYVDALKDDEFLTEVLAALAPLEVRWTILDDIGAGTLPHAWKRLRHSHGPLACTVDEVASDIRERPYGQGVLAGEGALAALPDDLGARTVRSIWDGLISGGEYGNEATTGGLSVPAMMRPREQALLQRAARDHYTGGGEIVDAGAFLGASTVAFASGLSERADAAGLFRRIHSYDLFLKTNRSHDAHIDDSVERNASFEHLYHGNLGELAGRVNVYAGDFSSMRWIGQPIEIFFADVAKSPELDAHVYAEFARWWVPGMTLYVQQDFVHAEAPWVQVSIGALLDHFEILGVEPPSLVLGLASPLDADVVARIAARDFTTDEQVAHVMRLFDALEHDEARGTMLLIAARIEAAGGRHKRAFRRVRRCVDEFGSLDDHWFQQRIRKTRQHVRGSRRTGVSEPDG